MGLQHVNLVLKLNEQNSSLVYDGWTDTSANTKTCDRQASRITSDIVVSLDAPVIVKQPDFSNNTNNKAQRIPFLVLGG